MFDELDHPQAVTHPLSFIGVVIPSPVRRLRTTIDHTAASSAYRVLARWHRIFDATPANDLVATFQAPSPWLSAPRLAQPKGTTRGCSHGGQWQLLW